MSRPNTKRHTDFTIISEWIGAGSSVLDLGCGRGVLLEHLRQTRQVRGVGVDNDFVKIQSCVKKGLSAYQGDAESFLSEFPDHFFDWVILSRTLQEMAQPGRVVAQSLRVGKALAVGFVNHGYWRNRLSLAFTGRPISNEVFPHAWQDDSPSNPVTVESFERFCSEAGYRIRERVYLRGDWRSPIQLWPNLLCGYAVYAIEQGKAEA